MKSPSLVSLGLVLFVSSVARAEVESPARPPEPEKELVGWNIDVRTSLVVPIGSFADAPGLGLFSSYKGYGAGNTFSFSNDYGDVKLGVGYRVPIRPTKSPSWYGLDVFFDADGGRFTSGSVQSADGRSIDADIPSDKQSFHVMLELGVGAHFTP